MSGLRADVHGGQLGQDDSWSRSTNEQFSDMVSSYSRVHLAAVAVIGGMVNKAIMKAVGFGREVMLSDNDRCPFCKKVIDFDSFKDALSRKEFDISGLCQICQDKTFTEDE